MSDLDVDAIESRAFGEGFTQGEHVTYDRVAHYLYEEDCRD